MKSTLFLCGAGNAEGVRLALRVNEKESRWEKIVILDDDASKKGKSIIGVQIAGSFDQLKNADPKTCEVVNLVARTSQKRQAAYKKIKTYGIPFTTLIDPSVDIQGVEFSNDITIYQNVTFSAGAFVDEESVVFTGAIVGHGCRVGKFCIIAPGAVLNARVIMNDGVYIGTNASVLPDLKIGSWAKIGLNSAVVQDIPDGATVMGVPGEILMIEKHDKKESQPEEAEIKIKSLEEEQRLSSVEQELTRIWSQVLGIEKIGIHDNFFDLGGDSILTIQIVGKANQAGLPISVRQLLDNQTIAELAKIVNTTNVLKSNEEIISGAVQLTPVQNWLLDQDLPELHHYNQTMLLKLPENIDIALLEKAAHFMLKQHDSLRLRFKKNGGRWEQFYGDLNEGRTFEEVDLSEFPAEQINIELISKIDQFQAALNLEDGPIFKAVHFNLGSGKQGRLLLIIHHLAVDGISWRILIEDLQDAYLQLSGSEHIKLPDKTMSFQNWAKNISEYAQSLSIISEKEFWLNDRYKNISPIKLDYSNGDNTEASTKKIIVKLNAKETQDLLQKASAAYNTQINDLLLTALSKTIAEWNGESKVLLDLEGHGREEIIKGANISRTIGWFTSIFPVTLEYYKHQSVGENLKSIKEQLRKIPNNGIGYGLLKYLCKSVDIKDQLNKMPKAEIQFNYLGQFSQVFKDSELFEIAPEPPGAFARVASSVQPRPYKLEILGIIADNELQFEWLYCENLFKQSSIENLTDEFINNLREIISHCINKNNKEFTPSDFPLADLDQQKLNKIYEKLRQQKVN